MFDFIKNVVKYGFIKSIFLYGNRLYYKLRFKNDLILGLGTNLNHVIVGKKVFIGSQSFVLNSKIGDYSYLNSNVKIRDSIIGKFCSIGPGVKIVLGNHPTDMVSTHPSFYSNNKPFLTFSDKMYFEEYKSVTIGNDVWIGEDVLIPGGVKIGDGAIITSRAVVTKDVEPYSIVGGIPAKLIKYRFDEDTRAKIANSKWWDNDDKWFKANFKKFHDPKMF